MSAINIIPRKTSLRPLVVLMLVFLFINLAYTQDSISKGAQYYKNALRLHEIPDSFIFYTEKAIPIFKEEANWSSYFNAKSSLRDVYFIYKKNIQKADSLALELEQEAYSNSLDKHIDAQTSALSRLANYYSKYRSDYPKAIECIDRVVSILERIENEEEKQLSQANMYANLGFFHKSKGDTYTAINYYRESIRKIEAVQPIKHSNHAIVNYNLAKALSSIGQYQEAKQYIQTAVHSIHQVKKGTERLQLNIGLYEIENEISLKAAENAHRLLNKNKGKYDAYPELEAKFLQCAARTYSLTGDKTKTKKAFEKAIKAYEAVFDANHIESAKLYFFYTETLLKYGEKDKALDFINKSLTAYGWNDNDAQKKDNPRKYKHQVELVKALFLKGKILNALNQKKNALFAFEEATRISIIARKSYNSDASKFALAKTTESILKNGVQIGAELYRSTKKSSYLQSVFSFMESSKSIQLLDALQNAEAAGLSQLPTSLQKQLKTLQNKINTYDEWLRKTENAALEQERFQANQELESLKKKISMEFPSYFDYQFSEKEITLSDIQKRLGSKECILNFFETDIHLYNLKISPSTVELHQSLFDSTEKKIVLDFSRRIHTNPNLNKQWFIEDAYNSYQILLSDVLDNKDYKIIIQPSPSLHLLPFECLLSKETSSKKWSELPYLILEKEIQYAYSSMTWAKQKESKNQKQLSVGFAPIFEQNERDLATLSHSPQELGMIGGKSFLGSKATSDNFLDIAPKAKLIHLSTHASFSSEQNDAQIEFIDKPLSLRNIYSLSLNNELTVLSACETAKGELKSGEGLMSLARSFAYAGSKSIIASLWQVNDAATSKLVQGFYTSIAKGKTKREALRQAKIDYLTQIDILQSEKTPYYWAAMVLIGSDGILKAKQSSLYNNYFLIFGIILLVLVFLWYRNRLKTNQN